MSSIAWLLALIVFGFMLRRGYRIVMYDIPYAKAQQRAKLAARDAELNRPKLNPAALRRVRVTQAIRGLKIARAQLGYQLEHRYGELAYFRHRSKSRRYSRFSIDIGVHCLLVVVWLTDDEWVDGAPGIVEGKSYAQFVASIPQASYGYPVQIIAARFNSPT